MRTIFLAMIMIGFATLSTPFVYSESLSAASVKCAMLSFDKAYERAEAVFVGKVLNTSKTGNTRKVKFLVQRHWKGITKQEVSVIVNENFKNGC